MYRLFTRTHGQEQVFGKVNKASKPSPEEFFEE